MHQILKAVRDERPDVAFVHCNEAEVFNANLSIEMHQWHCGGTTKRTLERQFLWNVGPLWNVGKWEREVEVASSWPLTFKWDLLSSPQQWSLLRRSSNVCRGTITPSFPVRASPPLFDTSTGRHMEVRWKSACEWLNQTKVVQGALCSLTVPNCSCGSSAHVCSFAFLVPRRAALRKRQEVDVEVMEVKVSLAGLTRISNEDIRLQQADAVEAKDGLEGDRGRWLAVASSAQQRKLGWWLVSYVCNKYKQKTIEFNQMTNTDSDFFHHKQHAIFIISPDSPLKYKKGVNYNQYFKCNRMSNSFQLVGSLLTLIKVKILLVMLAWLQHHYFHWIKNTIKPKNSGNYSSSSKFRVDSPTVVYHIND